MRVGPCEAGWRRNFAAFEQRGLPCARLVLAADQVPGLALPVGLDARCREKAFAAAIAELFVALYGAEMLAVAIGEWPRLVAAVAVGRDAGD